MNCFESRREILADPARPGAGAREHARACAGCAQMLESTLALDDAIRQALTVPVPEGIAERALAATVRARTFSRGMLALAASLLLVVAVGAGFLVLGRDDPFARAGIDFVVDEEANAILTAKPADSGALTAVVRAMDLALPAQIGEIRYIGTCPFQGTIAHHVVLITPQGKATLLLFPGKTLSNRGRASARGLESVVAPTGGGSLAIIGETARGVRRIESMVIRG